MPLRLDAQNNLESAAARSSRRPARRAAGHGRGQRGHDYCQKSRSCAACFVSTISGPRTSGVREIRAGCKFPSACTFFAVTTPSGTQRRTRHFIIKRIWTASIGNRYAHRVSVRSRESAGALSFLKNLLGISNGGASGAKEGARMRNRSSERHVKLVRRQPKRSCGASKYSRAQQRAHDNDRVCP